MGKPVPRQCWVSPAIAGDRPPRYGCRGRFPFTVGLGPSDATRACERVPLAMPRSRGTGPRATVSKTAPFTVGRGPVPRRASIERETALVCVRFSRRSGDRGGLSPALRYPKPPFHRRARACPSPCLDREGNGLGLRAFVAQVRRSRGTGPRATIQ